MIVPSAPRSILSHHMLCCRHDHEEAVVKQVCWQIERMCERL